MQNLESSKIFKNQTLIFKKKIAKSTGANNFSILLFKY